MGRKFCAELCEDLHLVLSCAGGGFLCGTCAGIGVHKIDFRLQLVVPAKPPKSQLRANAPLC